MASTLLPDSYGLSRKLDLQNERRPFLLITLGSLLLAVVPGLLGVVFLPVLLVERRLILIGLACLLLFLTAAALLHGPLHGLAMRLLSGSRPGYRRGGILPELHSEAFFSPREYRFVAIAPLLFESLILLPPVFLLPAVLKWPFYWSETLALALSAEDLYLFFYTLPMPSQTLIRDNGQVLQLFMPEGKTIEPIS